jgi:hypothetical protein
MLQLPPNFGSCLQKGIAALGDKNGKHEVETTGQHVSLTISQYDAEVFAVVREKLLDQQPGAFFDEICNGGQLPEAKLERTGKSGSIFLTSPNRLYIIKSATEGELRSLRLFAPDYLEHIQNNPDSLLCKFCGLYRVTAKSPEGDLDMPLVVMRSAFPVDRRKDYAYDLKGTTEDRYMMRSGSAEQVLKDLNFAEDQGVLVVPPLLWDQIQMAAREDVMFLQQHGIMDYSLLVGIYKVRPGEEEDFNKASLQAEAQATRVLKLRTFPGWRNDGEAVMISFCIVDILQRWTLKKRCAHVLKKCFYCSRRRIDTEPPNKYGQRFGLMVEEVLRPGDRNSLETSLVSIDGAGESCEGDPVAIYSLKSTHGIADHLAFCSYCKSFQDKQPGDAELLAFSDLISGCGVAPLIDAGLVKASVTSELAEFKKELCNVPMHARSKDAQTGDTWHNFARTFINKNKLKGKLVTHSSENHMLACAVSVGVDASTQVSAWMHDRFAPFFLANPELSRRPASSSALRCLHLPERGSWFSEAHLMPGFVFSELAPEEFRRLRINSGWDDNEYRKSICGCNVSFIQFATNSKSGEFFFFSGDSRLLVKTASSKEVRTMRRLLRQGYVDHLTSEEGSLLTRIYGIYEVFVPNLRHGKRINFIVQDNMLHWPKLPLHERFDLKGSTRNRRARQTEFVLKDLNWEGSISLEKSPTDKLLKQHRCDCAFLKEGEVIDYSVMIGIHIPEDDVDDRPARSKSGWGALRNIVRKEQVGLYGPIKGPDQRQFLIGIIDYMTPWDCKKYLEYKYKKLTWNGGGASCVPPEHYAARQVAFIESLMAPVADLAQPHIAVPQVSAATILQGLSTLPGMVDSDARSLRVAGKGEEANSAPELSAKSEASDMA